MILAAIYTALFISIILIITPGFASNDSTDQYLQAIGSKPLNDWHPIGMTLMWRFLLTITAWKGSLVALQLLLLIIGLFFLSVSFFHQTKSRRISLIPILILLLPNVIGLIGYNWKDVQLAAALTLSSCLLYTVSIMKLSKTIRLTLVAAALLSCAYTLTLRTNAIFAALPIIYYATRLIYRTKAYWKLAMAALGITLLCMLPFLLLTKLADPAKGRIETSMMALDVVNITSPESIRKADLPIPLKNGLLRMSKCTHFGSGLNLNFFACESNFSDTSVYIKHHSTLKEYWLDVVKRNPRSYLLFKLESFMIFAFPPQNSQYIIDPHGNRFIDEGNVDSHVAGATQAYTINFGYSTASFLFKAWFYILTAIVLLLLSKKYPDKRFIQVLAISSLLYIASFAPSSVTPDYRYILWPVLAIFIAVSIMIRSKLDSSYIS